MEEGINKRIVVSENLVSDIDLDGEIGVIASKLLELEKLYLNKGYSNLKLEIQYTATDATFYSVFGDRLENDWEHNARVREMKREREMAARKKLDRKTSNQMLRKQLKVQSENPL